MKNFFWRTAGVVLLSIHGFSSLAIGAEDRNPLGESAPYELDKGNGRTSAMVISGQSSATVDSYFEDSPIGPGYSVLLSYDFQAYVQGRVQGDMRFNFPESFFTPQFMIDFRRTKYFETPDYKMRHEGRGDAKTLNGQFYRECDIVFTYDIKDPTFLASLRQLLAAAAGIDLRSEIFLSAKIDDVKIRSYVHPSVPALGAAKVDITGKVNGISVKAGLDFAP
jgi:hypothetical protein